MRKRNDKLIRQLNEEKRNTRERNRDWLFLGIYLGLAVAAVATFEQGQYIASGIVMFGLGAVFGYTFRIPMRK